MQFQYIYLLVTAVIIHTSYSGVATVALAMTRSSIAGRAVVKSLSVTDISNSSTASRRILVQHDLAPETTGPVPTTRGVPESDLLICIVKRWYSSDGQWNECYDAFSSFWNSAGDMQDNEIGERKEGLNEQTLMIGAGFKLILLIPFLAILAGKAILLSLVSLLITSLAFLHKSQNNLFH